MRNSNEDKIRLTFIRHGLTRSNLEKRYIGKTDEPLCLDGILSLIDRVEKGIYPGADMVFSSPLIRCVKTAEIIYPLREAIVIPQLEETDFGDFEGRTYRELSGDPRYQRWIDSGGTMAFPNGESQTEFISRTKTGFYLALDKIHKDGGKNVSMIVHGGTIMALMSLFGDGGFFDFQIENGGGFTCELVERGEALLFEDPVRLALKGKMEVWK